MPLSTAYTNRGRDTVLRLGLLVIGLLAGCVNTGSEDVRPSDVAVSTRLEVESFDRPPIAVETSSLRRSEEAWASHQVMIRGAQPDWFIGIKIPSQVFEAASGQLVPVEPLVDRRDGLTPGIGGLSFEVRVGDEEGLLPGTHEFRLLIPIWLGVDTIETAPPDGSVTIIFSYLVIDPTDREHAQPFCEVALPDDDFMSPTVAELIQMAETAQAILPPVQADEVTTRATQLATDMELFEDGTRNEYNTRSIAEIVGAICGVELNSVGASSD